MSICQIAIIPHLFLPSKNSNFVAENLINASLPRRTIQPMAATTTNQTKPEEVSSTLTDGTTMKNGTSMTKTIKQNKHTKFIRTKYLFFS